MQKNIIHIVGDKFEQFSQNEHVVKIQNIEERLQNGDYRPEENTKYLLSQGIAHDRASKLMDIVKKRGLDNFFDQPKARLATKDISHKRNSKNIMISDPVKLSQDEFELEMLLDDSCADMSDHLTGQHVQGMVLIESARQAFLAVTEKYFVDANIKYYFVINSFNVKYLGFIFPLGAQINYKVNKAELDDPNRLVFSTTMEFSQSGGAVGCQVDVEFTAFESSIIESIEAKRSIAAIENARVAFANSHNDETQTKDSAMLSAV